MKVGLDIHGVIDVYPCIFRQLSQKFIDEGHEVHIVTGQQWHIAVEEVEGLNIPYTHYFSIVDHHLALGTPMNEKENGWWMEGKTWDESKGIYCREQDIGLHFDNDIKYAEYFPDACTFVWVRSGFGKIWELFL